MKAFFDHNIEPFIARAIHTAVSPRGDEVHALVDKFPKQTADVDWLSAIGLEGGWVVFTYDKRILRNPVERNAFFDAGLTAFFLRPAVQKQNALHRMATILWHWDKISTFTSMQERGAYWLPQNKTSKFEQVRI